MKQMICITLLLVFSILCILPGCGSGTQADSGAVVARVGDAVLTVKDFKILRQSLTSQLKLGQPRLTDEQILDRWIGWQVIIAKAKQNGMDKDPAMRFRIIEAQARVYGSLIHQQMVEDQIPPPSEDELKQYFQSHIKEYTAKNPAAWLYIMNVKEEAEAREAVAKLRAGEDFDAVAKQYAENYDEKRGCNIGYRDIKSFNADQQKAIENLPIGALSDPIALKSADGKSIRSYSILKVMDKVEANTPLKYEGINPNQLKQRLYMELKIEVEQNAEKELFSGIKVEKFTDRIPAPEPGELPEGPAKGPVAKEPPVVQPMAK